MRQLGETTRSAKTPCDFEKIRSNPEIFTQFVLDPTSLNLDNSTRINSSDPIVGELINNSRDLCYSIHTERMKLLKNIEKKQKTMEIKKKKQKKKQK